MNELLKITLAMDNDQKMRAEKIFSEAYGISLEQACDLFITQTLKEGKIPFAIEGLKKSISPKIKALANEVKQASEKVLGDKLEKVMIYGSYARGDYDEASDVDFFILADVMQEECSLWRKRIEELMPDIDLMYDTIVSIHLTSKETFEKYYDALPFYQNIMKDGVELYAG